MRKFIFSALMISGMLFATAGYAQQAQGIVAPTTVSEATEVVTDAASDAAQASQKSDSEKDEKGQK